MTSPPYNRRRAPAKAEGEDQSPDPSNSPSPRVSAENPLPDSMPRARRQRGVSRQLATGDQVTYPEQIDSYSVLADAPWGSAPMIWRDSTHLEVLYDHRLDVTLGAPCCEPLLIAYAQTRFEARIVEDASDRVTVVRLKHIDTRNLITERGTRPSNPNGGRTHAAASARVVARWLAQWLNEHPAAKRHCSAIAVHNEFVRAQYEDPEYRKDARLGEVRRVMERAPATVTWMLMHEDACVREWAMLRYVPLLPPGESPTASAIGVNEL